MYKKYKDIIAGSVLLILSLFYLSLTFGIKKIAFIDPVTGSALFPQIVASILILCSVIIIAKGVIVLKKTNVQNQNSKSLLEAADEAENGVDTRNDKEVRKGNIKVVLVLVSFALFCFFMDKIGFGPVSFLYLWSQMIIMAPKKQIKKQILLEGVLSLVLATGIFCLFRYGFGLILPRALWF